MPYDAMLCYAMLYDAMLRYTKYYIIYYILYTIRYRLYTVCYILYMYTYIAGTIHFLLYTVYSILHTLRYILCYVILYYTILHVTTPCHTVLCYIIYDPIWRVTWQPVGFIRKATNKTRSGRRVVSLRLLGSSQLTIRSTAEKSCLPPAAYLRALLWA